MIEKVKNTKIQYEIISRREGDLAASFSNSDKAKKLLG
jgi:UDP-glucose 4-epimerase